MSGALRLELTGAPPRRPADARVWELYRVGQRVLDRPDEQAAREAIGHLERALELDPEFAPAHAALGWAWLEVCDRNYETCREALPRAWQAVDRALEIDDSLSTAHHWRAELLGREYRWAEAEAAHRLAAELNAGRLPSMFLGHLVMAVGRVDEGFELLDRKIEDAFLVPMANIGAGASRIVMGVDLERALEYTERAAVLEPDLWQLAFMRWLGTLQLGREQAALHGLLTAPFPEDVRDAILEAHAASGWEGVHPILMQHAIDVTGRDCGYSIQWGADMLLRMGDRDGALDCLERGHRDRSLAPWMQIKHSIMWDALRDEPRFQRILEEAGLAG